MSPMSTSFKRHRHVPLTDITPGSVFRRTQVALAINSVVRSGQLILGAEVEKFEQALAGQVGVNHAVGVANGTEAIALSLMALGVERGDEVITASHTALATVAGISMAGATPVLVDVNRHFMTIDSASVEAAISPRTAAVVAVHLYGQAAEIQDLRSLCNHHGLALIEDVAQAQGGRSKDQVLGSFGDAATFSFYPTKNLGALGDAGAVVTNRPDVARNLRQLRQYGWDGDRISRSAGINSRMDELQAAVLRLRIGGLDAAVAARREVAREYGRLLDSESLVLPTERSESFHAYHLYVVRCQHRASLMEHLEKRGIQTGVHYPIPAHRQPGFVDKVRIASDLEVTEALVDTVLSLPIYPRLRRKAIARVASSVNEFFGGDSC